MRAFTHPLIGWAKPTPVDPRNFRHPVLDDILTSVAGPVSNFIVATGAVLVLGWWRLSLLWGSHIRVARVCYGDRFDSAPIGLLFYELMLINIVLAVFNLIPVPPLDGSHVLRHFLPAGRMVYDRIGILACWPWCSGAAGCSGADPPVSDFLTLPPGNLMTSRTTKKRVLSGMRSTGKLHLGNYVGALENWVRMQDQYDCFFFVADWHALTTDYADTSRMKENSVEVLLDWLAAGLDPERCTMFIQSHVPQHAELHLLLSMITPLGWLERVPTYKEQRENIKEKDLGTYGFLGYPVLQSADILIYKADFVPVGEDQVAHVELTREIARRFNMFYSGKRDVRFSRAAAAAHAGRQAARHRRPQDVEVVRQRHHAHRSRTRGAAEAEDHGDRSGPGAAQRSRQSRRLSGGRPAQNIQRPKKPWPR